MKYLRKFADWDAYLAYLQTDDTNLPLIAYIHNSGSRVDPPKTDRFDKDGPCWVYFEDIGDRFIQVANNGTMYFTDTVIDGVSYTARVEEGTDGNYTLVIKSVDGQEQNTDNVSIGTGANADTIFVDWGETVY